MIEIIAHGLVGKSDLPIPVWLFGWGAAIALIVSFVALAFGWREPRLASLRERPLFRLPARPLELLLGALGVVLFAYVVYAGFHGEQNVQDNLAPPFIFIWFWVGTAFLSVLFGDVFAVLSPWRAVGRACGWVMRRLGQDIEPYPYPERLGRWPAVIGLAAFAWLELASQDRNDPSFLAWMAILYAGVQLCGMAIYGERTWSQRGDGLGVFFSFIASLSPLRWEDGRLHLRPPGIGARAIDPLPATTALVLLSIGTTTFDGFSAGDMWADANPWLQDLFRDIGIGGQWPLAFAATVGMLGGVGLVTGFYFLGLWGVRGIDRSRSLRELAQLFAHTLVPIAAAYVFAHYFSLLVNDGQVVASLLSDPFGYGDDFLGTAGWEPNLGWIAANTIWYVQIVFLLAGHVTGLVLAHDRALELYPEGAAASRSQYWMLAVMVGFTSLALWLLSLSA